MVTIGDDRYWAFFTDVRPVCKMLWIRTWCTSTSNIVVLVYIMVHKFAFFLCFEVKALVVSSRSIVRISSKVKTYLCYTMVLYTRRACFFCLINHGRLNSTNIFWNTGHHRFFVFVWTARPPSDTNQWIKISTSILGIWYVSSGEHVKVLRNFCGYDDIVACFFFCGMFCGVVAIRALENATFPSWLLSSLLECAGL